MSSTSLYFLSRDLTKKNFQPYIDRLDNTYTGFARSIGYSIRLFIYCINLYYTAVMYYELFVSGGICVRRDCFRGDFIILCPRKRKELKDWTDIFILLLTYV